MTSFKSELSGQAFPESQKIPIESIRKGIFDLMKNEKPKIKHTGYISINELDEYRQKYIDLSLKKEVNELSSLKKEVFDKLKKQELISDNIDGEWNQKVTFGQKVADNVAAFGGSWKFIIFFSAFILLWILLNVYALFFRSFDPYPFILLNLLLSCLAALQAPVIMMSQNRSEAKDRKRAKEDYKINLKSEIEIQMLHEKLDHLIIHQQGQLFEIQNIQVEMLKDIVTELAELKKGKNNKNEKG